MVANSIARALSPGFAPGLNFRRWRLLEPAARDLYVVWEESTDVLMSGLREVAASDPDDPRLRSLIDELSSGGDRFRELWECADVGYRWVPSTCATQRSVMCSCTATGSTSRTPVASTC